MAPAQQIVITTELEKPFSTLFGCLRMTFRTVFAGVVKFSGDRCRFAWAHQVNFGFNSMYSFGFLLCFSDYSIANKKENYRCKH